MLKSLVISLMALIIAAGPGFAQIMPVPTGEGYFEYDPTETGVVSADPAQAKPLSVGPVAKGGENINIRVSLPAFSAPVDIYVALHAPEVHPDIFLLRPDNTLRPSSGDLVPWKANTLGPIDESLFGDIPSSLLPEEIYYLYLMVTPATAAQPASAARAAAASFKYNAWRSVAPNSRIFGQLGFFYGYNFPQANLSVEGGDFCFFWVDKNNVVHGTSTGIFFPKGGGGDKDCPWTITAGVNVDVLGGRLLKTDGQRTLELQIGHQISEEWTNKCPGIPPIPIQNAGTNSFALPFENGASLVSDSLLIDIFLSIFRDR